MTPYALRVTGATLASLGLLFTSGILAHAGNSAAQIYWADSGQKIRRIDSDGANLATLVPNAFDNIGDLVVDPRNNNTFWNTGFFIYRSNLDGAGITAIFEFPPEAFPGDVAIDPQTNKLFFVDGRNNIIYSSNLDGSNASTIVPATGTPSNTDGISDLVVDSANAKLYWNYDSRVYRTNLDGSNKEEVLYSDWRIEDFDIDFQQQEIYWTYAPGPRGSAEVRRADLHGGASELLMSGLWLTPGLVLDPAHGKMYVSDTWYSGPVNYDSTIRSANLDGTDQQILINLGPSGIQQALEMTLLSTTIPEPTVPSLLAAASLAWVMARNRDRNRAVRAK